MPAKGCGVVRLSAPEHGKDARATEDGCRLTFRCMSLDAKVVDAVHCAVGTTGRPYVMRARAKATEGTRRSILLAGLERARETMSVDVPLADIAGRAGVSVQTVLRHFGSKEGLYGELETFAREHVIAERAAPAGDAHAAVRALIGHYETTGDWALAMLAQERRDERARQVTDRGRAVHREWVRSVFAPQLLQRSPGNRGPLTDLLVVATDVYAWKLLRRDRGLGPAAVERRIRLMVQALLSSEES